MLDDFDALWRISGFQSETDATKYIDNAIASSVINPNLWEMHEDGPYSFTIHGARELWMTGTFPTAHALRDVMLRSLSDHDDVLLALTPWNFSFMPIAAKERWMLSDHFTARAVRAHMLGCLLTMDKIRYGMDNPSRVVRLKVDDSPLGFPFVRAEYETQSQTCDDCDWRLVPATKHVCSFRNRKTSECVVFRFHMNAI